LAALSGKAFRTLSGQAEMMHENFMRMALPVFAVCCLRMKFYDYTHIFLQLFRRVCFTDLIGNYTTEPENFP